MKIPRTQADLQRLIDDKVEESLHLDYKAADALGGTDGKKKEIRKDVSSFANADGGIIIYGMTECQEADRKHLPEKPDPIDRTEFSKERLDQIIGEIRPRIEGLEIIPIPIGDSGVCYAVVIPKSDTVHQASDHKYYRRRNFESSPMDDYEVREGMNRSRHPQLDAKIRVMIDPLIPRIQGSRILVQIKNTSALIANHYCVRIGFPVKLSDGRPVSISEDAAYLEEVDGSWKWILRCNSETPLYPEDDHQVRFGFNVPDRWEPDLNANDVIAIHLFADSAPPTILSRSLADSEKDWT